MNIFFQTGPSGGKGERGDKGDRGITTTLKGDQFPTGIIEGPPGPPGRVKPTTRKKINAYC